MVSRRRSFTREFKIEAVQMLTITDESVQQVAEDLGIHPNTLYKWVRQYGEHPEEAFPGKGRQTSEAEQVRQLQCENQRLRMERDILKKAMVDSTDQCNTL
jgi:transposase